MYGLFISLFLRVVLWLFDLDRRIFSHILNHVVLGQIN